MLEKLVNKLIPTVALTGLLSLSACTIYKPMNPELSRPAKEFPAVTKKRFSAEPYTGVVRELIEEDNDYDEYYVALTSGDKKLTEFHAIESKVGNGKHNWIILYPILGGDDLLLIGYIAREVLSAHGISTVAVMRKELLIPDEEPYRPLRSDDPNVVDFEDYVKNAAKDTVRILEYLKSKDMRKFGLMGISYGAMQAVGIAPFVPDAKVIMLLMGGGDLGEIIMNSTEEPVTRYRKYLLEEYGGEKNLRKTIDELKLDPVLSAPYIPTDKVRMIVTTKDDVVPSRCQLLLYEELGKPTALFVPSNHYTAILYYFQIRNCIVDELKKAFEKE